MGQAGTSTVPVDDGSGINAIYIDGIPVPEGIDPSFLEALPDSIRMEVNTCARVILSSLSFELNSSAYRSFRPPLYFNLSFYLYKYFYTLHNP